MAKKQAWGAGSGRGRSAVLKQRLPTYRYLRERARHRVPRFAFDFVDGGTGEHLGARKNHNALDSIEVIPRYGDTQTINTEVQLFEKYYASPIGISPVGVDSLIWPGATRLLAQAAQSTKIPYILGTLASASIEEVAEICPDSVWLQLYGLPRDEHRVTFDLIDRAHRANVNVIVATLDAPVRAKRPLDLRNGLVVPFRPSAYMLWQMATSLPWTMALLRSGPPKFANIERYVRGKGQAPSMSETAGFVQQEIKGTFDWDTIARMRDKWPNALVLKGIQHPDDALRAARLGVNGLLVSNHGGRQSDASPPAVDVLPNIVDAVGKRTTILFDSGIRSGLDILRALGLGAKATFCGRAFLFGVAALGHEGAEYVVTMLREELQTAMAQNGANDLASVGKISIRRTHPRD